MTAPATPAFKALKCWVTPEGVGHVQLNRPRSANSMNEDMWLELPVALPWLESRGARVVILSGAGKNFCAGIDVGSLGGAMKALAEAPCGGRAAWDFRPFLGTLQTAVSSLENCRVPTVALVQGACYGAGVDLITACDVRLCSADATFCVKEVDLAVVADMGTLSRLPSIVGHGVAMDLSLSARVMRAPEALAVRLVSSVAGDVDALAAAGAKYAEGLAAKPPVALAGTKHVLLYQRDHAAVADGLAYVTIWNASALRSTDMQEVFAARAAGRTPVFSKL